MLTLSGYDNSQGDAYKIYVSDANNVVVLNASNVDVTSYLITNSILVENATPVTVTDNHGWVANTISVRAYDWQAVCALAFDVTEKFIAMSKVQNAGETPIMFARIVDSFTGDALTQSDISSIKYTIYKYGYGTARSGSYGKVAVGTSWTNQDVTVSDVIIDTPVSNDPRVDFAYNFKFEPNTLTDNPFADPGKFSVDFTITPTNGNKIPVIFEFNLV